MQLMHTNMHYRLTPDPQQTPEEGGHDVTHINNLHTLIGQESRMQVTRMALWTKSQLGTYKCFLLS